MNEEERKKLETIALERPLESGDGENLGMGPIRFLTLRRMHLAHRALLLADHRSTKWGHSEQRVEKTVAPTLIRTKDTPGTQTAPQIRAL
jgi:hypothetical protein